MLDQYLAVEPAAQYQHLYGLLAPHAGLRYSGPVAGYSFRHLRNRMYDMVVVIGPSHYSYPAALISTGHDAYQTPLGTIPVAKNILQQLSKQLDILQVRKDPEHAIEMELLFLQHLLGEFQLVPLAMLDQSYAVAEQLSNALGELLKGSRVLYVASSDLSHFYQQNVAKVLDRAVLEEVARYNPAGIIQAEEEGRGFACGRAAIAAVMLAARQQGAQQATIEHHATSGDVSGDMTRVVGYGAATFHD
jgi:hypothetical protein